MFITAVVVVGVILFVVFLVVLAVLIICCILRRKRSGKYSVSLGESRKRGLNLSKQSGGSAQQDNGGIAGEEETVDVGINEVRAVFSTGPLIKDSRGKTEWLCITRWRSLQDLHYTEGHRPEAV